MLRILETLKIRYLHDINSTQVVLLRQNCMFILQFRPKLSDFREGKKRAKIKKTEKVSVFRKKKADEKLLKGFEKFRYWLKCIKCMEYDECQSSAKSCFKAVFSKRDHHRQFLKVTKSQGILIWFRQNWHFEDWKVTENKINTLRRYLIPLKAWSWRNSPGHCDRWSQRSFSLRKKKNCWKWI